MNFKSMVMSNMEILPDCFRIRLTAPKKILCALPGQFVTVRVRDAIDPLLRRPFSIFSRGSVAPDHDGAQRRYYLEILYKVVGKGTSMLSELHSGDYVEVLGPLGKGFVTGGPDVEYLLVGGGIGLAPLYFLARELVAKSTVKVFIGGRRKADILCVTEFDQLGIDTYVATDDGTLGSKGMVTDVLGEHLAATGRGRGKQAVYACGPHGMLAAVTGISSDFGVPCQVSLEANMACGVGACLGCVTKGINHSEAAPDYRCVCKDGPVFDSAELLWV
jgi:dihydroorotate dehydrogenase electron transfer subunit